MTGRRKKKTGKKRSPPPAWPLLFVKILTHFKGTYSVHYSLFFINVCTNFVHYLYIIEAVQCTVYIVGHLVWSGKGYKGYKPWKVGPVDKEDNVWFNLWNPYSQKHNCCRTNLSICTIAKLEHVHFSRKKSQHTRTSVAKIKTYSHFCCEKHNICVILSQKNNIHTSKLCALLKHFIHWKNCTLHYFAQTEIGTLPGDLLCTLFIIFH